MFLEADNLMQIEAIKAEQDGLKKFQLYFDYLQDLSRNKDATIVTINKENLGQEELKVFQDFIYFLRSLNKDKHDLTFINENVKNILDNLGKCKDANFVNWINNKIFPFSSLKYLSITWDGNGSSEDGIKFLVETVLKNIDPQNIF
ncbi:MAG: hypothetical protein NT034_00500 [Candidatus Magasanikbacteria bacterium]|nr:hypothetical protein [Candidatus Magasanikbacteria bacterium]